MSRKKRRRKPVNSKKVTFNGIEFKSSLELYMYKALNKEKIKFRNK